MEQGGLSLPRRLMRGKFGRAPTLEFGVHGLYKLNRLNPEGSMHFLSDLQSPLKEYDRSFQVSEERKKGL